MVDCEKQSVPFVTALRRGNFMRSVPIEGAAHHWMCQPFDEPHSDTFFLAPALLRFLTERL